MDIRKQVGWNLRALRLKRGLSQEAVAGTAVNPAHISRIERGEENPTIKVLAALAKTIGVDIREFFKPVKPGTPLPEPLKKGRKVGSPFRRG